MPVDESFRLDPTTRSHIAAAYDHDAVERLLQHVTPLERSFLLDEFLRPEFRSTPPIPNQWHVLTGSSDARLNELLAEVWQPFWDAQPDEILNEPDTHYPGRELALRRRRGEV